MRDEPHDRKSPQAKKALSYAKDRRNAYGENDKSSRKAIRFRKASENRSDRRKVRDTIAKMLELPEERADLVESSIRNDFNRVGGWKKEPDMRLREFLALQQKFRSVRQQRSS